MAGVMAAVQVTMGAWQAEDEPGRLGFEQNQGRAGPYGRSRGGLPSPEYGRREREVREMVSGSFVIFSKSKNQFYKFNFSPSSWLQMKNL